MNKQLIQGIINVGNKDIEVSPVKYTVETKDITYYSYDRLYYDDNHVEFADDYDDKITLSYYDIFSIRIGNL